MQPDAHAADAEPDGSLAAIGWNGERMLLREPSGTPEEARDLALDLLTQLD
jgi:hypothetical protein